MAVPPEPTPEDDRQDAPDQDEQQRGAEAQSVAPSALTRFAERFRIPLGAVVAVIGAGLAVVFAVRPLDGASSAGLITQGAGVALWLCVLGVGVTWALDTSRRLTNAFVIGCVLCYLVFFFSGR